MVTVSATTRGDTPSSLANWEEDLDKMKDHWTKEYVRFILLAIENLIKC